MTAPALSARARINHATRRRQKQHCRPLPRITGSEWAERYRVLSPESSSRHGPWRNDVTPYLVEIINACTDRQTQEVCVIAPSQSGKSEVILNTIGYFAHQEPSPMILIQPTVEAAESFSKDRVAPMIRDCPALGQLFAEVKSRESGNTIRSKSYPGGQLDFVGANAPAGLAMRPKRVVLLDERDRHPASAGSEGDVKGIASARTRTYQRRRKIVEVTSPTTEEDSLAWPSFLAGTQEVREVPCPHCGTFQTLEFPRLKWDTDADGAVDPTTVRYDCAGCDVPIRPTSRAAMDRAGRWVATAKPKTLYKRSFRIHGLLAGFALWEELASEFVACKGDPVKLKTFVNTALGELWKDRAVEDQKAVLAARALPYDPERRWHVPREGAILTCGVDVQPDRFEVVVRAWGAGETSWLIERAIIRGDTTQAPVRLNLGEYLTRRTWRHELGAPMQIRSTCIDAGDGNMQAVIVAFALANGARHVRAIKGSSNPETPMTPKKPTKVKGGRLFVLGVNAITERIMRRLGMDTPGAGFLHLNDFADDDYLTQLLSESRVIDPKTRKRRWQVKAGARNEVLDCEKYAYAALLLGPVPVASLADEAAKVAEAGANAPPAPPIDEDAAPMIPDLPKPAAPRRPRGSWVQGWRR
jgi:phage terminase large subunit GpA-like protein